jgi:hypothetical protein
MNDVGTRTTDQISLRMIVRSLQGLARACKARMGTRYSVPCIAHYCRVLRADQGQPRVEWCQHSVAYASPINRS